MKRLHMVFMGSIILFFVLGGIYCSSAQEGSNLPDGMKILKEKMDQQHVPTVDFSRFKFEFPETMPDTLNFIKGYLWHGQHINPARRAQAGPVAYLFLISFNKETQEISFFRAYEQTAKIPSGWGVLTGKLDPSNNRKIDLQTKDGSSFVIIMNDKDHMTVKAHTGFEAQMKKIGLISPPK